MSVGTSKLNNNKMAIIYRVDNRNFGSSLSLVDDEGKRISDDKIIEDMARILKFGLVGVLNKRGKEKEIGNKLKEIYGKGT